MEFPPLELLIQHLTERGKVEVDLALARWQNAALQQRIVELEEQAARERSS